MRRLVALLPAAVVLMLVAPAAAVWSTTSSGTARIGATTMTNASGLTATCTRNNKNSTVELAWTISPDTYMEGYEIVRVGSGGGTDATLQAARTTSSLVDSPPTGPGISYSYSIRAGSTTIAWRTPFLAAVGTPTYTRNSCTSA